MENSTRGNAASPAFVAAPEIPTARATNPPITTSTPARAGRSAQVGRSSDQHSEHPTVEHAKGERDSTEVLRQEGESRQRLEAAQTSVSSARPLTRGESSEARGEPAGDAGTGPGVGRGSNGRADHSEVLNGRRPEGDARLLHDLRPSDNDMNAVPE